MIATVLCGCGRVAFQSRAEDANTTIDASAYEYVSFEAESGQVTPKFAVMPDPTASGGEYVIDTDNAGLTGPGSLINTFQLAVGPVPFYLWARVIADDSASDSFMLSVDGAAAIPFRTCVYGLSPSWQWVPVTADCPAGVDCCPTTNLGYSFTEGSHVLELTSREGGSIIDRIVVTNDPDYTGG